ncbi:MAG TPA: hypothetical protein PLN91_11490 [Rhodanobacteraceae bacterium]|nr:hypothetical protein [Rhodanobacteraceae bacterium]
MPDILVRHIDDATAERIKAIARERQWSINEVILHALRHGLGLSGEDPARRELHDIAYLRGTWEPTEAAAFREAVSAFEQVDGKPLYVDDKSPK